MFSTFNETLEPCDWMAQKCIPPLPAADSWLAAEGLKATS